MRLRHQARSPAQPNAPAPIAVGPNVDPALQQAISDAESDLVSAQRDLAEKQARFTEQHPDVLAAQQHVAQAQAKVSKLRAQATAARPSFLSPSPAPVVENPEETQAKLGAEISKVEAAIAAKRSGVDGGVVGIDSNWVVALETEWASLNREVADIRERNQQIQARFFRASMVASVEASGQSAQMVVVDPPFKPTKPYKRGYFRVMGTAALITILLGLSACFLLALLDDRIYDEVDIRRLEIGPLAHVVPKQLKAKKGIRNG
jgi:Tfp pilus assembly protein FimV